MSSIFAPSKLIFEEVTASKTAEVDHAYMVNSGVLVDLDMPAVAALDSEILIYNVGAGLFKLSTTAAISIKMEVTTTGAFEELSCLDQYGSIRLKCVVANTTWAVVGYEGRFSGSSGNIYSSSYNQVEYFTTTRAAVTGSGAQNITTTGYINKLNISLSDDGDLANHSSGVADDSGNNTCTVFSNALSPLEDNGVAAKAWDGTDGYSLTVATFAPNVYRITWVQIGIGQPVTLHAWGDKR